jgi:hypothetical protein
MNEQRKKARQKNEARNERQDGTDTAKKSLGQELIAQNLAEGIELGALSRRSRNLSAV